MQQQHTLVMVVVVVGVSSSSSGSSSKKATEIKYKIYRYHPRYRCIPGTQVYKFCLLLVLSPSSLRSQIQDIRSNK